MHDSLKPIISRRIQPFSSKKKGSQIADVILLLEFRLRVFLFHCPESGRGSEKSVHPMFIQYPPECSGIRGADRFSLIKDGAASMNQRSIDDVGVTHHPANVGSRPINLSGIGVEYRFHAVFEGNGMASVFPYHSLRQTGGPRSIKNVKRIGGIHRHRINRIRR